MGSSLQFARGIAITCCWKCQARNVTLRKVGAKDYACPTHYPEAPQVEEVSKVFVKTKQQEAEEKAAIDQIVAEARSKIDKPTNS